MNRILSYFDDRQQLRDHCRQLTALAGDAAEFCESLHEGNAIVCFIEDVLLIEDVDSATEQAATWLRETGIKILAAADRLEGGAA